jgi:hypothetical protein
MEAKEGIFRDFEGNSTQLLQQLRSMAGSLRQTNSTGKRYHVPGAHVSMSATLDWITPTSLDELD